MGTHAFSHGLWSCGLCIYIIVTADYKWDSVNFWAYYDYTYVSGYPNV